MMETNPGPTILIISRAKSGRDLFEFPAERQSYTLQALVEVTTKLLVLKTFWKSYCLILPPSSGQSHPHKSSFQVCRTTQFRLSIKATAKTQALEAFWPSHILQVLLKVTTRSRALKGCWRTRPPSMDSGPNVKL